MSILKQLLLLCVLVGLSYGGYEYYRTQYAGAPEEQSGPEGARPVTVELTHAEIRTLRRTVEAVGTTRAVRSIDIVPEVDGRLVELTISPGTQVSEGDVLARLEDTIERADLSEAEAVLTEQRQAVQRARQLRETNAVSLATLEEAIARLAEAEADVDRARRRLEDRRITAPFGGVVGLTNYDSGARVEEGEILTRLDDLSEVEVEFSLPETVFAQVNRGQQVIARSAAFPDREFIGTIDVVDSRIDPVSRAFRTRAVVPNPDSTLPAGMFLSLTLVLSQDDRVTVPEEAIIFQAAETYVFVARDNVAQRRVVRTGQRQDGRIAILSGLDEGEAVVVRGLQRVRDGSPLNILQTDDAATASAEAEPEQPT
ncbi:multidrug resistance protein MdtA precursor [Roseovarius sp. A-2]|uniref:efflux RND transporter periplasmic adaptor subunit n=1 Tax=Roseovarius sp. A-2 TaxID=1570360 RepID=UPI0009B507CE|nr:efflux RND transporter periplasmic adaptor subunit [Roseovarius sp. A-2]GAW34960.1 multidrug resistance protein MdtA precursor [Roseovarius sp. A-2]